MTLLEYKNVSKNFGKTEVLHDVNLKIPSGKIIGLLGKNGMGKTTIIKLANDLLTPTSGEVLFEGKPIGINSKRNISYLPERTHLDKVMTVRQSLNYFAEFYDNFNINKATRLIDNLDLSCIPLLIWRILVSNERSRLSMRRSAKLYILDEPLGGIDPATRDYILDTILHNFNEGASVLISTHLIADIERILDEVIFIDNGEIILQADADKLRTKHNASIDEIFRKEFKNAR